MQNKSNSCSLYFTVKGSGKVAGLGLSIAYAIIQEHNGIFEIESEVAKGTTIKARLAISKENGNKS